MIVVDSSALIAILEQESEAERFLSILRGVQLRLASAVTVYETGLVLVGRRGRESAADLMISLDELAIEIVPFAEPYISGALEAYPNHFRQNCSDRKGGLGRCPTLLDGFNEIWVYADEINALTARRAGRAPSVTIP